MSGCRCLEIDVWNGEPKTNDEADAEGGESKHHGRPRLNSRISERLDRLAHRGHSPARAPAPASTSWGMPAPRTSTPTQSRAEPRVLHGHTLTKEVSFRDVCGAIRESAFVTSDLPVIVSLEVHAGLDQQQIMVEIMEETWKDILVAVTPPMEEGAEALPSPADLRRKILIKVKWAAPEKKTEESNNPLDHVKSNSSSEDERAPQGGAKKKSSNILQALSHLGIYTRSYHFKNLSQPGNSCSAKW